MKYLLILRLFALVFLFSGLFVGRTFATLVAIDISDRGHYTNNGLHVDSNQNTITGPGFIEDSNSWFLFDLNGLVGSASSAVLRLELETWAGTVAMPGTVSIGVVSIWDFGSSTSALVTSHAFGSSEGISIYNDLESGTMYASKSINTSSIGDVIEFSLSPAALAEINTAIEDGAQFALGTHLEPDPASPDWLRWSSGNEPRIHQLVIDIEPIPEPSSSLFFVIGLFSVMFRRRSESK